VGNRAALVRVPGMGRRRHVEYRAGDNAANPYLYLTALLAAGLDGIERQLPAPAPANQDVGHASPAELAAAGIGFLPRSLPEALAALADDRILVEGLGALIHAEFIKVKQAELASYSLHVHPWERQTYLEVL
jgi:glutamine synthetase